MDEMPAATTREDLADNLKPAWKKVPHETINNLINGIPERMQASVQGKGGYVGNQTVSPLRLVFATTTMIKPPHQFWDSLYKYRPLFGTDHENWKLHSGR